MQKIFFSYSRVDGSNFAARLALDLKRKDFDVWIDQEDIRAGSEWDLEIQKALQSCDCLLFIETPKSVVSNNVLNEVYFAIEQRKKVIPCIFLDSETPFRLQRLQHINFTKDYNAGLSLLVNELVRDNSSLVIQPAVNHTAIEVDKPFFAKYQALILFISAILIVIAALIIYNADNNNAIPTEKNSTAGSNDSITSEQASTAIEPSSTSIKEARRIKEKNRKDVRVKRSINNLIKRDTATVSSTRKVPELNEIFTGNWELVDVDPKAQFKRGYLKIVPLDEKKVTIKSYLQFYYPETGEASFVSVFNAFAGCSACILMKDMKIVNEDVAIGSRVIKTLKEDQADGRKAGDTILNAGLNKSIQASITLHFVDNRTAVIKVQRTVETALAEGLTLQPFVYSFFFRKNQ